MKKLIAAGAICAAALGAVATAQAGPEAQDANGNFIVYDADFAPPATGKGVKVTTATFDVSFGNKKTGAPFPQTEKLNLVMPKGTKYNGTKFPKCGVKADNTLDCGKDARVGKGTAVIDARALGIQDPVKADVTAYNGPLRNKKATLILHAQATVNGQPLEAGIDFQWTGKALELFYTDNTRIAYSFSSFHLDLGAYFKSKTSGNPAVTTSLIQPPKTCTSKGWAFSLFHADAAGNTITAPDVQPCVRVK
jgi:hypothetical protein